MPKVYLSGSVQEKNLYAVGLGNEEGHMQAVARRAAEVLESQGVTVYVNDPSWRLEQIVEDSNSKQPDSIWLFTVTQESDVAAKCMLMTGVARAKSWLRPFMQRWNH